MISKYIKKLYLQTFFIVSLCLLLIFSPFSMTTSIATNDKENEEDVSLIVEDENESLTEDTLDYSDEALDEENSTEENILEDDAIEEAESVHENEEQSSEEDATEIEAKDEDSMMFEVTMDSSPNVFGDFEYEETDDGTIIITKYTGSTTVVDIPDQIDGKDVTIIDEFVFNNKQLTSVSLPNKLKEIRRDAFRNNRISSIQLPDTLEVIGLGGLSDNLFTTITLPNNLKILEVNALRDNNLISIELPPNIEKIGNLAFYNNNLTSIHIPSNVKTIGLAAFENNDLTSVYLSEGVERIETRAFRDNYLTTIHLPKSINHVAATVFYNNKLTNVYVENANTNFNNQAFDGTQTNPADLTIWGHDPSTAKTLAENKGYTFRILSDHYSDYTWVELTPDTVEITGYNGLSLQVNIPNLIEDKTVTRIGDHAFLNKGIEKVSFPTSIKSIGVGAFLNNSLTEVVLPPNLEVVGVDAFKTNNILSITLPAKLEVIGNGAFIGNQLETISVHGENNHFKDINNKGLYTKDGKTLIQGTVSGKIAEGTEVINDEAFSSLGITSIDIPSSVTTIKQNAFRDNNLQKVVLPNSVNNIEANAFIYNQLSEVVFMNPSVTISEFGAFANNQAHPNDLHIFGFIGSTAETFANGHNHTFHYIVDVNGNTTVPVVPGTTVGVYDENTPLATLQIPNSPDLDGTFLEITNNSDLVVPHLVKAGGIFDFTFTNAQGDPIDVNGDFELSIYINSTSNNPAIYHEEENGNWTRIGGTIANGFITASVQDFSNYGVFSDLGVLDISVEVMFHGEKPTSITAYLLDEDNHNVVDEIVLSDINDWKHTFTNVPQVIDGNMVSYYVETEELDGYMHFENSVENNNFEFVYFEIFEFTVTKIWEDDPIDFRDKTPIDSIYVTIMAEFNGFEEFFDEILLTEEDEWTATVVAPVEFDGDIIKYTVFEEPILGYESTVTGNIEDGFVITNTAVDTIEITVTKEWDGTPQDSVYVELYGAISYYEFFIGSIELSEANNWTHTFDPFPVKTAGENIEFFIWEDVPEGYINTIKGNTENGFVITNIELDETEYFEIEIEKVWNEPSPPDKWVLVYVLADGERVFEPLALSYENNWKSTFYYMLPREINGKEVEYTVEEVPIEGYETTIEGNAEDGFVITNTPISDSTPQPETIDITVEKVWVGEKQDSVTIYLLANGDRTGDSITLSDANNWEDVFTDLPVELDGEAVEYSVEELEIDGYVSTISGSAEDGFIVTNTEITEEEPIDENPIEDDPAEEEPGDESQVEEDSIEEKPTGEVKDITIEEDDTSKKVGKKVLPKTATTIYSILLAGIGFMLTGIVIYFMARRKRFE